MKIRFLEYACYITILLLSFSNPCFSQKAVEDQQIEVALRTVGHEFLMCLGDSTSRIMPVVKEDNNRYRIRFEHELAFSPDDLVNVANEVMEKYDIASSYIVAVEECSSSEVVYIYEMNKMQPELAPCRSRDLPKSCYNLVVTLYNNTDSSMSKDLYVYSKDKGGKANGLFIVLVGLALFFSIYLFYIKKRKEESTNSLIRVGQYRFDLNNTRLVLKDKVIELTQKEADLLLLLCESFNNTVEREKILNKVWGDEGDYVGRTLDVFISKLRKKLEADPEIKIVNIRGVGYKLVG